MNFHVSAFAVIALAVIQAVGVAGGKDAKPVVIDGQLAGKDSPAKRHSVALREDVVYVIDLVSKDCDAYLRLEDAAGKNLGEDDDSGGGTNARLFFIPRESADYVLIATSARPQTGKYRLTVREAHLDFKALPLDKGAVTEKDRLAVNGPRSPFGRLGSCKLYRVELKAGATYVFDLISSNFDAYLTLADGTLKRLASDDDSGGNRNARIVFPCKADGTYCLAATGLGTPEGAFELRIRVRAEK
jgi:hypothetical protein